MDLRSCLAQMVEEGLVVKIDDLIDWNLEAGAIMRYANELGSPAQWFTNMKDAMPGATLLGGLYATDERKAVILGLPRDASYHDIVDFYCDNIVKRIKPVIVRSGLCQQNVLTGDDMDLYRFPIPKLHPQDGNRYIGTLDIGVCKDPDSDWVNWGMYRGMLRDKRTTNIFLGPLNHGGQIFKKYSERKQAMEFVYFFGGDPLYGMVAASGVPYGISEVEVVGGMRGKPVELVKCKTVNLDVPADAELVLEGTITPGDVADEGPFGEYPGYVVGAVTKRPVYRLSAITYRDNPIFPATCLGMPTDDNSIWGLSTAASIKLALRDKGVPFSKVAIPAEGGWGAVIVSTRTPIAGVPQLIASIIWSDRGGAYIPYVIVVNDDVDPANLGEVFHAICTKCNPVKGVHVFPGFVNSPLAPYVERSHFKEVGLGGGNILLDCTWPIDWKPEDIPARLAFETTYDEQLKAKVLGNVRRWGLSK